jgi:eukaryotic-like serine/threonine-protein kinase
MDLPVDLLQDMARRLQFLFAIMLAISVLQILFVELSHAEVNKAIRYTTTAVNWAVTIAAFAVVRRGKLSPPRLMALGLAYEVFVALTIAIGTVESTWQARPMFVWSPVAVWILVFPIIVPSPTRHAAITSALSAAAEPVVAIAFALVGALEMPTAGEIARNTWPNVLAAAIAIASARMVYGLGQKLAKARAMGSYHLTEKLGAGGMGEVWRAKHRLLAREAAVKLIRASSWGSGDPESVTRAFQRFEQEAQATSQLHSPHTIGVYDFGQSRDGTFYYVMELLDGMDLATLVEHHGPQPPERLVYLLAQACHSLNEAHNRGLIHRDIKPANIFMCRYGDDLDFVKVLDFGLVKQRLTEGEVGPGVTREGMIAGTPTFMAPEMALGNPVDGRADIYALGCVAYWLLTGEGVFKEASTMGVLTAHIRETPIPVSARSPLEVPTDLERVIMACLAKKPDERPQTAEELGNLLTAVPLSSVWTRQRAAEWWATNGPAPLGRKEVTPE